MSEVTDNKITKPDNSMICLTLEKVMKVSEQSKQMQ